MSKIKSKSFLLLSCFQYSNVANVNSYMPEQTPEKLPLCDAESLLCNTDYPNSLPTKVTLIFLNILLTPLLLTYHGFRIYVAPCMSIYFSRVCCWVACLICTCEWWIYKDKTFPPDSNSIGDVEADTSNVIWLRGKELRQDTKKDGHPHLFDAGVEAADICQGALGNCWLMSALACLTEFPGSIENVFVQREYNPRGKYSLKLFDIQKKVWTTVNVDDLIPCDGDDRKPIFAKPNGDELWVLLVEKAVAKFCGSYSGTEGGLVAWALETLTGNAVLMYDLREDGNWERKELVVSPTEGNKRRCLARSHNPPKLFDKINFFTLLAMYDNKNCLLSASSHGKDDTRRTEGRGENETGIVPGHAYTIISAYQSKVDR